MPAGPKHRPIAIVFRIVEKFSFPVYEFANLFQSVVIIFALVGVRRRPYVQFEGDRPLGK